MAVTNNLKIWSTSNTYANDAAFSSDTYLNNGFAANNPISSKTFNTILLELSLTNKAIYSALATIGSSLTATLDLSTSASDLATFVIAALKKTQVENADYATSAGSATNATNADSATYATSAGSAATATTATSADFAQGADTANNIAGGSKGAIPYQTGSDSTAFLTAGTSGSLLQTKGNNAAPAWISPTALTVGEAFYAQTADNIANGAANSIPYQTAIDTTGFITQATGSTKVLSQSPNNAPAFVDPTILVIASTSSGITPPSSDVSNPYINTKFVNPSASTSHIRINGSGGTSVKGNGSNITISSPSIPDDLPATFVTVPPTGNNSDGIKFVMLDSSSYAPASVTTYSGYIYMWY